ncbi:peroxisomal membrane protein 2 [Carlito syrichta]|uniref:Peroxisomal membrane protein 2 n=1 Tax=Carlito syrichta TaxID=1868482 RepID=A0A1U7SUL5_CARSF|nr:peroxisomal membrane protein 2 [Carlito syrichta]
MELPGAKRRPGEPDRGPPLPRHHTREHRGDSRTDDPRRASPVPRPARSIQAARGICAPPGSRHDVPWARRGGILSALGNFLAQMIEKKRKKESSQNLDVKGLLRYATFGLFFTGPLSHHFYLFLERCVPPEVPLAGLKRLLLDRLLFAPGFLLLFFLAMNFLEGKDASAFAAKMRGSFWPALRMNWRVWTPLQFININYVPIQFRVLFANLVALFWYAYLASLEK